MLLYTGGGVKMRRVADVSDFALFFFESLLFSTHCVDIAVHFKSYSRLFGKGGFVNPRVEVRREDVLVARIYLWSYVSFVE